MSYKQQHFYGAFIWHNFLKKLQEFVLYIEDNER